MSIIEIIGISILGMCVVFLVLIVLMCLIRIFTAIMTASEKRKVAIAAAPTGVITGVQRRGSMGEVNTFNVSDPTAVMIMAIVAAEIGAPLNELKFLSIKQVEDEPK